MPKTFERIDLIEEWLFELNLLELNEREAELVKGKAESVEQAFTDLVRICEERYKDNSFFPDFRKIGFEYKKNLKPLQRIFCIDL